MDIDQLEEHPQRLTTDALSSDSDVSYDYFKAHRRASPINPEASLYLAVLENGIESYCKYLDNKTRRGQRLFKEAEDWFFAGDDDWFCSFENVCAILSIDPDYVRRGLRRRYDKTHANEVYPSDSLQSAMEKDAA